MKATTDSIKRAFDLACSLEGTSFTTMIQLKCAKEAFECGCPDRAMKRLRGARSNLVKLRRSQTAAIKNIDDAIASAKGGLR